MTLESSSAVQTDGLLNPPTDAGLPGAIYYGFNPVDCGAYVIGIEKVSDAAVEFLSLIKKHLAEGKKHLAGVSLPTWRSFMELEKANSSVLVSVRYEGRMIGYFFFAMEADFYSSDAVVAVERGFWIDEEHRKGGLALNMLKFAEETAKKLGCGFLGVGDTSPAGGVSLAALMKRRKFKPATLNYYKEL